MDSLSSSTSTKMKNNNKLSVRNETRFKKSFLLLREKTVLKKALELSILCDNDICVIHYDREGNLVNTYPEDQCQVKDILERYNRLSDREKIKKNTNLSQFYNKKLVDEKRRSLTDAEERKKFTKKVGEFKGSLVDQLLVLQDRARYLLYSQDHQTKPDQSRCLAAMSEQNHNFSAPSSGFFPHNDFSSSLIDEEDPLMNFCPPVTENRV
ncbi:agamous-like MADS-box protein AGL53 [Brassica rapa]|uniref:agamous-like MADS-box protein AGL53 n=1 Tax=Brassica campestris TaxID=3711 RepID=UPI00142D7123|nr:agamous-like MADS-box protein AGL53 [Brassica rapa]